MSEVSRYLNKKNETMMIVHDIDEQTKVKNRLIDKLKTISDDREFILSVINSAKCIDDRKTIIDFIDNSENATYENVLLLALTLYEEKTNQEN